MRRFGLMLLPLFALCLAGCGGVSEAEQGLIDTIKLMDDTSAAIERNDEAEMLRLGTALKEQGTKMKSLRPSDSEQERLKEKYAEPLKQAGKRLFEAGAKNPKLMERFKGMNNPFSKL